MAVDIACSGLEPTQTVSGFVSGGRIWLDVHVDRVGGDSIYIPSGNAYIPSGAVGLQAGMGRLGSVSFTFDSNDYLSGIQIIEGGVTRTIAVTISGAGRITNLVETVS